VASAQRAAVEDEHSSITGHAGRPPTGPVQLRVRDMGSGDSQVVLVGVRLDPGPAGRRPIAAVELRYRDLFSTRDESLSRPVVAEAARLTGYDPTFDVEVLRNVTIQSTAEGLREVDRLYKAQRYPDAWRVTQRLEGDLRRVARLASDDQLLQDADTMRRYGDTLAKWVERQTGRAPGAEPAPSRAITPAATSPTSPLDSARVRQPLPTPLDIR
jgi:hypothetical protein